VALPTAVNFQGVEYTAVYATTNSTIVFGQMDNNYATYPNTPSISVNAYDWVVLDPANPNPTNSYFQILIPSGPRSISVDLEIIDMQGRILERKSSVKTNEMVHCGMTLRRGVYILKLHHGKLQKSFRIVKQ
jgi:hypothetical protein